MIENEQLQQLLNEIVNSRTELKTAIETSETKILLKIESLNEKIKQLENENKELKNNIERLERKSKENGIMIFGLKKNEEVISLDSTLNELKNLLGVSVSEKDINNFISFKNSRNNPVKIDFVSNLKKREIIRNCRKLKDTQISIVHDQTFEQRKENKVLRYHLEKARKNSSVKSYIKGNKLYIDGTVYTTETLPESPDNTENRSRSQSLRQKIRHRKSESESDLEFEQRQTSQKIGNQEKESISAVPLKNINQKKLPKENQNAATSAERTRLRSVNKK